MVDVTLELWRLPKVAEKTGVSSATIWRWVAAGTFPEPRRVGANAVAWRSDEVLTWMDACPVVAGLAKAG